MIKFRYSRSKVGLHKGFPLMYYTRGEVAASSSKNVRREEDEEGRGRT
jgi:hypothetical protein